MLLFLVLYSLFIEKYVKIFSHNPLWIKRLIKILPINNNIIILNVLVSLNLLKNIRILYLFIATIKATYKPLVNDASLKYYLNSPNEDIRTVSNVLYNSIKNY